MEQYDYGSELIAKWVRSGHLTEANEEHHLKIAQRLEGAYRRSLGQRGDTNAVNREIEALRREGYFGPQKRSNEPTTRVQSRKVRSRVRGVRHSF